MKLAKKIFLLPIFALAIICLIVLPNVYLVDTGTGVQFVSDSPSESRSKSLVVYVSGAIANPGVYEFDTSTRIYEVVEKAGGFSSNVDSDWVNSELNLASFVTDSQHIFIPDLAKSQVVSNSATHLVSLNNASLSELMELPGVGEATAQAIVAARPFASLEQLLEVKGIGESKFNQIKDKVSL